MLIVCAFPKSKDHHLRSAIDRFLGLGLDTRFYLVSSASAEKFYRARFGSLPIRIYAPAVDMAGCHIAEAGLLVGRMIAQDEAAGKHCILLSPYPFAWHLGKRLEQTGAQSVQIAPSSVRSVIDEAIGQILFALGQDSYDAIAEKAVRIARDVLAGLNGSAAVSVWADAVFEVFPQLKEPSARRTILGVSRMGDFARKLGFSVVGSMFSDTAAATGPLPSPKQMARIYAENRDSFGKLPLLAWTRLVLEKYPVLEDRKIREELFGSRRFEKIAANISLSVRDGEIVSLGGTARSGKVCEGV